MLYGILFSQHLQKQASPAAIGGGLLGLPLAGLGLANDGISMATFGLVGNPVNMFGNREVKDKSVVDNVVFRNGQYWSNKGTDVGDDVVMRHLMSNVSMPDVDSPLVRNNRRFDRSGALSRELKGDGFGHVLRLSPGFDESGMMSTLSKYKRKKVQDARHTALERMTGNTYTPEMAAGAKQRRAMAEQQQNGGQI